MALAAGATLGLAGCGETIQSEDYSLYAEEINYTGSIRISLAHPFEVDNDDYELLFAAKTEASDLGVCVAGVACAPGSDDYYPAKLIYATETKKFFKTVASAFLEDGLTLQVVAHSAAGDEVDARNIEFVRVGGDEEPPAEDEEAGDPPPEDGNAGEAGGGGVTAADVQGIVQTSCGGGGCHPGFASNLDGMKTNGSAGRIQNGTMPIGGRNLSGADKQKLLDFLGG